MDTYLVSMADNKWVDYYIVDCKTWDSLEGDEAQRIGALDDLDADGREYNEEEIFVHFSKFLEAKEYLDAYPAVKITDQFVSMWY